MNAIELADAVVALDLAEGPNNYGAYALRQDAMDWMQANQFVRNWNVVGAVMEMMIKAGPDKLRTVAGTWYPTMEIFAATIATSAAPTYGVYSERVNKSLPRAIIEVCVKARS